MGEWQNGGGRWSRVVRGRGKSYNNDKSAGRNDPGKKGFFCAWAGCRAAMFQQETWAGSACCHACDRPKGTALNPPVEMAVQWAHDLRAAKKKAKDEALIADDNPWGAANIDDWNRFGRDKDSKSEELSQLRETRLAELKNLPDKPGPKPNGPPASDVPMVPVEKVALSKDTIARRKLIGCYVSPTPPSGDSLYPLPVTKGHKTPAAVVAEAMVGNSGMLIAQHKDKIVLLLHNISVVEGMDYAEDAKKSFQ